jgi:hypothetical protein
MPAAHLPGYQEYYYSLNRHDRKRVAYLQWDLILSDFAAGIEFRSLVCWHEAVDRARDAGIKPKRDSNDETPSRVTGQYAKVFHEIDKSPSMCDDSDDELKPKKRIKQIKKAKVVKASSDYFGV